MNPLALEALGKVINAFGDLAKIVGSGWLALILLGTTFLVLAYRLILDREKSKRELAYVRHLERDIEELNKRLELYREKLLEAKGVDPAISAELRKLIEK